MNEWFRRFSSKVSTLSGSSWVFILALLSILVWAFTGYFFDFSNTWQLVINTGTTIITFLMVFIIQNTQNRDGKAIHAKLDELIRAKKDADNSFIDIEKVSEKELEEKLASVRRAREVALDKAEKG